MNTDTILISEMIKDFKNVIKCFNDFINNWEEKLQEYKIGQSIKDNNSILNTKENRQEDFKKNNMESEWVEMNGKEHNFPDMIF